MRVLVVEDEKKTASFIRKALQAEGFAVDVCHHGDDALAAARATPFNALVLDIMLPGRDGLSVLRQLRAAGVQTPVLLLSARGEVNERVEGLDAGADDYLPKPFVIAELVARVRALGRRTGETKSTVLRVADLSLDTLTRIAQRGDKVMELTTREFRLLEFLMRSTGRICSRMAIIEKVWDYDFDPGTNVVDVYIMRLREKFDTDFEPKLLHTVRGIGYVIQGDTMTIRTRLSLWYAVVLTVSLLIIGVGAYIEISEQLHNPRHHESPTRYALVEAGELLFLVGLPAVVLGLAGGWWLTRRALAPIAALTQAAKRISERNLTDQLPRTHNGDEMDRLTEVLNGMTARLDGSFQSIREFTLHASHELKTPLTVMHGELETALGEENLTPAQRERLLSQLDEVQRLAKIVNGLTLLTKADAGQVILRSEVVRLDELVQDVFADAQILAQSSGLEVKLAACEVATVRGDRHRLRQLLLNLADNAVKYCQPRGRVTLGLLRVNQHAEFVITNTGPGIAPEILPRVFDRFYRADPAHGREEEGCGLGLSIAQWIVRAHHGEIKIESGQIKIESGPSQLTTVTVRLPLGAEETKLA